MADPGIAPLAGATAWRRSPGIAPLNSQLGVFSGIPSRVYRAKNLLRIAGLRYRQRMAGKRPARRKLDIRVTDEVHEALQQMAAHMRLNMTQIVGRALKTALQNPITVEDIEFLEPRLLNLDIEEEALAAKAKLDMEKARLVLKRIEGWRAAKRRTQGEDATAKTGS
jgi:hypothetical protein